MSDIGLLFGVAVIGTPAVILLWRLVLRLRGSIAALFKAGRSIAVVVAGAVLFACALAAVGYAAVFVIELYELLTCRGSSCAQGGLGTFVFTPIVWLSWLVARAITDIFDLAERIG